MIHRALSALSSWFQAMRKHLVGHQEFYLYLPIGILVLTCGIRYVGFVTGRDVTEDVSAIIPGLIFLVFELLVVAFIGFVQQHLIGYRSEKENPTWGEELFDAANFWLLFFLLNLFAYKALMGTLA